MNDNPVLFIGVSLVSGFPLGFMLSVLIFAVRAIVTVFKRIAS